MKKIVEGISDGSPEFNDAIATSKDATEPCYKLTAPIRENGRKGGRPGGRGGNSGRGDGGGQFGTLFGF